MVNFFSRSKKIIVMIILTVMVVSIVAPVFATDSSASVGTSFLDSIIEMFKNILNAILSIFNPDPVDPVDPVDPPKPVEVTSVSISGNKNVKVGNTITLKATVSPSSATNKTITWSSGNKSIATVDKNGNVKGVKNGNVDITATSSNGKKATYKITVEDANKKGITRTSVEPTGSDWKTYCKNMDANNGEWLSYIDASCKKHGVRRDTVMAMIYQESRGISLGVNSSGYCGLMQVHYDKKSDLEPKNNIDKGAAELAAHIKYWDGNERNGIQAYFSGDAGLKKKIKNGGAYTYYNSVAKYRDEINKLYNFN